MYCMSSKVSEQRNSKKRLIRALNNDAEELSFVWQPETAGLDVPLSMKHDGAAYYYVTDGNKNVTALYDATGAEAANYVYGPFGQTLAANGRGGESPAAVDYEGGKVAAICNLLSCNGDEMHRPEDLDLDMLFCMELGGDSGIGGDGNASALRTVFGMEAMDRQYGASATSPLPPGGLALVNPFRFSSEFHDDELGLIYYNYRYYNPQLGRWTKRDPIGEDGGINLYTVLENNLYNHWDSLGLGRFYLIVRSASEIRSTKKGDTTSPMGYEVTYYPDAGECTGGKIVLVQYLNGKHDGYATETYIDAFGVTRVGAYTDFGPLNEPEKPLERGRLGILWTPRINAYIDSPYKTMKGVYGEGDLRFEPRQYNIEVKAYCRCKDSDNYLRSFSFIFSRARDGEGTFSFPGWTVRQSQQRTHKLAPSGYWIY